MSNRLPGPRSPEDLTDRRNEEVYVDGYNVTDGMTAFTGDANVSDTDIPVFGQKDNITGTITTSSNLSMTVLEQNEKSNGLMRLLHGMKPSSNPLNDPKSYKPNKLKEVNTLAMRKKNDESAVVMSRFWPGVQFGAAYPSGGPDDKSQRAFNGKGGTCKEYDGLLTCDLIASGGGIAERLRTAPQLIDNAYAIHIEMIYAPGGDLASENLQREPIKDISTYSVDTTIKMVNSLGDVYWPACVEAVTMENTPNYAHVYYLLSGITGVPGTTSTIAPEGMRGSVT